MIADIERRGWLFLFQRAKTEVAEIDLIIQRRDEIRLLEVKVLDSPWRAFERVSHRQLQKLILNQMKLSSVSSRYRITCWVAFVETKQIRYVQIN